MLGKFIECEADKNGNYYRVIQTTKEYSDGKKFPINEVVESNKKIDFNTMDRTQIGGFCVSTYEYIFRWLIRGDTLCEVVIPEDDKIYKTTSENGIYVAEKIILTNPKKIDDNFATELYLHLTLPENSYFKSMTACAIMGYLNTALKVCDEHVTKENVCNAIFELESYCQRREKENYIDNALAIESVKILYNKLKQIENNK